MLRMCSSLSASSANSILLGSESTLHERCTVTAPASTSGPAGLPFFFGTIELPPIVCNAITLKPEAVPAFDEFALLLLPDIDMVALSILTTTLLSQSLYSGRQTVTPILRSCVVMSAACHISRSVMVSARSRSPTSQRIISTHGVISTSLTDCPGVDKTHINNYHCSCKPNPRV